MPDNENYVTKDECQKTMIDVKDTMDTVLKALVGDDLRGGLVKDVSELKTVAQGINELKADVKSVLKARGCPDARPKWGRREYALVVVALISAASSVAIAIIESLVH